MELKTFVSETISQIVEGVVEAQERTKNPGAIINPPLIHSSHGAVVNYAKGINNAPQNMDFDVTVSVESSSSTGGKGKIQIAMFGAEGGKTSDNKDASVSRIKFSVPVCWPVAPVPEIPLEKAVVSFGG